MGWLKQIFKAFVAIALIPVLLIGGFTAVSFVAPLCFGGLSHPLLGFLAVMMMIPWGLVFFIFFFAGMGPVTSIIMYPTGAKGGYAVYPRGKGNGDGGGVFLIFNILKTIFLVPIALIVWLIISLIIPFSLKLQNFIDEIYDNIVEQFKRWYLLGLIVFVAFPLIVLAMDAWENAAYSPDRLDFQVNDYSITHDKYNGNTYFTMYYSVHPNETDLRDLSGAWRFTDKKTGKTYESSNELLTPTLYWWNNDIDQTVPHNFKTTFYDQELNAFLSDEFDNIKIELVISKVEYASNIFILGDFLFPVINNEYKKGYVITVKP